MNYTWDFLFTEPPPPGRSWALTVGCEDAVCRVCRAAHGEDLGARMTAADLADWYAPRCRAAPFGWEENAPWRPGLPVPVSPRPGWVPAEQVLRRAKQPAVYAPDPALQRYFAGRRDRPRVEITGTALVVGGWAGVEALLYAEIAACVVVVEPAPRARWLLERNLALNPALAKRVRVVAEPVRAPGPVLFTNLGSGMDRPVLLLEVALDQLETLKPALRGFQVISEWSADALENIASFAGPVGHYAVIQPDAGSALVLADARLPETARVLPSARVRSPPATGDLIETAGASAADLSSAHPELADLELVVIDAPGSETEVLDALKPLLDEKKPMLMLSTLASDALGETNSARVRSALIDWSCVDVRTRRVLDDDAERFEVLCKRKLKD